MTKATNASALAKAFGNEPADKRMEILRLTGKSGSISQAARDAGVSYKAAWQAIDTLTNLAGVVLVERAVGGSGGGGASLTAAGEKLLSVADLLLQARSRVLSAIEQSQGVLPASFGMGLRTSMRNQFPCEIHKLEVKGQLVRVQLGLPDGSLLFSRITRASAELLGLKKKQQVLALFKATAVTIASTGRVAPASRVIPGGEGQALSGKVVRVSRSASGDEVSIQLPVGPQLVGFSVARSGFKVGAQAWALVNESAVVLALS